MWKSSVNKGLQRLTGYQVQRASTAAELAGQSKANERRAARLKTRPGAAQERVAERSARLDLVTKKLHLIDTYEGMPPRSGKDRRSNGETAEEMLAARDRDHRIWAIAELDDVQEAMRETAYPEDKIHYHQGMVEDTVPRLAPEQISLVRLDTDWYESTRHELEHLYDRLSPGGS